MAAAPRRPMRRAGAAALPRAFPSFSWGNGARGGRHGPMKMLVSPGPPDGRIRSARSHSARARPRARVSEREGGRESQSRSVVHARLWGGRRPSNPSLGDADCARGARRGARARRERVLQRLPPARLLAARRGRILRRWEAGRPRGKSGRPSRRARPSRASRAALAALGWPRAGGAPRRPLVRSASRGLRGGGLRRASSARDGARTLHGACSARRSAHGRTCHRRPLRSNDGACASAVPRGRWRGR